MRGLTALATGKMAINIECQPRAIRRHPSLTEDPKLTIVPLFQKSTIHSQIIHADAEKETSNLNGKRVAILATDGFEQSELLEPKKALEEAGATTQVVSPNSGKIKGWNHKDWGKEVPVDVTLDSAKADQFDALVLPGGVMNPDQLRMNPKAVEFVKQFTKNGKPVAAICHGPWTLVEADAVRGKV